MVELRRDLVELYSVLLSSGVVLEVAAHPKPGNVHRLRDFPDARFEDFLLTGLVFVGLIRRSILRGARILKRGPPPGKPIIGDLIYSAVAGSKAIHGGGNTCLGTALLLMPLGLSLGYSIASHGGEDLDQAMLLSSVPHLLDRYSSAEDAVYFYRAVRAASPSYVKPSDYTGVYPNVWDPQFRQKLESLGARLIDVLRHSARFDVVSREVVEGYKETFNASRFLEERLEMHGDWNRAVIEAFLLVLSRNTDTVIALKHGRGKALEASRRAAELLEEFLRDSPKAFEHLSGLDEEWGKEGANSGSSADITAVAISLYALRKRRGLLRP